jgi:HlyD family secretion protein
MIQGTEQQDIPLNNARLTRYPVRIIAAVILSAVALGSVARFDQHTGLVLPKDQVQIATVGRGDLVRDIAVQGKLVAANAPTLFSQAEGVVSFIKQPGEAVNIGELLAVIESPELTGEVKRQTLLLASMTADLERAQLNAREQRLDIEQLRDTAAINRHAAKRDLLRAESSITKGVISRVDYEVIQDNCAKAEMEYAHVERKLELVIDKLKFEHSATEQANARSGELGAVN